MLPGPLAGQLVYFAAAPAVSGGVSSAERGIQGATESPISLFGSRSD